MIGLLRTLTTSGTYRAEPPLALVFTAADYDEWRHYPKGTRTNPRTEIVVRQAWDDPPPERDLSGRSCLTDGQMGFEWRTGLDATRKCKCSPTWYLNCDG